MLLRPIKETGTLLPELVGVDRIIKDPLLTGSRARVVWPPLRITKEKKYRYPTRANLP